MSTFQEEKPVTVAPHTRVQYGKTQHVKSFQRPLVNEKLWIYIASLGMTYEDFEHPLNQNAQYASKWMMFSRRWGDHCTKRFKKKPVPMPRLSKLSVRPTNLPNYPVPRPRPARTFNH
jgi:hypothetical protein